MFQKISSAIQANQKRLSTAKEADNSPQASPRRSYQPNGGLDFDRASLIANAMNNCYYKSLKIYLFFHSSF